MQIQQSFTCPMHPEVVKDKPGNCPKCGMTLVLLKTPAQKSVSPEKPIDSDETVHHLKHVAGSTPTADRKASLQSLQKYTCPMHPQVVQDGPGKCPLCGMTLVPLKKSVSPGSHEGHPSGIADFKRGFM